MLQCEPMGELVERMAVPSPVGNGSLAVESDTGLGEMLAGARSRCCIFPPIFWFYFKENTAHRQQPVIVIWLRREISRLPHSGGLTSPRCASHFRTQLSGSFLCLLGSPPSWLLQINIHTPYASHSWQQLASFFWDGVRGGGGRIRAVSTTSRDISQGWSELRMAGLFRAKALLGWGVRIPWALD